MNRDQFEAKRSRYSAPAPTEPVMTEDGPLGTRPEQLRSGECVGQEKARATGVAARNTMENAGSIPEDEEDTAAYLAQRCYKFAK